MKTNGRSRTTHSALVGLASFSLLVLALAAAPRRARAMPQDWFTAGTGLGVQKARVAVADFVPGNPGSQPLAQLFTDTVRADLDYSGILDEVSKSFLPTADPGGPGALKESDWTAPPANAQFVGYGTLTASANTLRTDAWLSDVNTPGAAPVIGKVYPGTVTTEDVRRVAHEFADDIVMRLSGGAPGIAQTRIAFVSARSGNKEIWVMDYDGQNQQQLTHLDAISLMPRWSPDDSRIAFACLAGSFQICMYSMDLGRKVAFPHYRGTTASPTWSPDGTRLAFWSSLGGSPNIYTADSATGGNLKRITVGGGPDAQPVWNRKTGQQIVYVSGRSGLPQLYIMNSDGTNPEKIDLADKGYVVDPDWSPNGQLLAFSWQRPDGNYDIYVMDIGSSHKLVQVTRDSARNEKPSWAPDGRHLAFQSNRTGRWQIWTMLADGTEARQLTTEGENESPNWSPK